MVLSNTLLVDERGRVGPFAHRGGLAEVPPGTLRRAREGDARAFADILEHYDERLRALAWRVLHDRQAMDDVMQEAAIKAFRGLSEFRGDAALGTWLHRITYTTCLNHLRDHGSLPGLGGRDDEGGDGTGAGGNDPADLAAAELDLRDALLHLTPQQRVAVLLVIEQGYDLKSAGEILGIPAGTVGSRLTSARAALRRALRPSTGKGGTT